MKVVDAPLLEALAARAAAAPRGRVNHNLHPELGDAVQRFCNAMAPGTYVRPHRHVDPAKWELFVVLRGAFAVLIFDAKGRVEARIELRAGADAVAEVPPGVWHALVVLEPRTVAFEVKQGPYAAVSDKDFARWAPGEGEAGAAALELWYRTARPGDVAPGA